MYVYREKTKLEPLAETSGRVGHGVASLAQLHGVISGIVGCK